MENNDECRTNPLQYPMLLHYSNLLVWIKSVKSLLIIMSNYTHHPLSPTKYPMFKNIWASSSVPSKEWTTPPNIWSLCFLSILRTSVAAFRQCRNRGSLCFFAKSSWLSKYLNKCYLRSAMLYLKYIIIVLNNWNFSTTAYDVL